MNNSEIQPKLEAFERLLHIMDELREKCPWDKKQTIQSLRSLTLEETYELADAILLEDIQGLKEELGDLFLHLVFYSKIADENNWFTVSEVLNAVCEKLIHRHPHIYGDTTVQSEEDVKANWEKLKLSEGKKSVLQGVPASLPSIIKAQRMQDKTRQLGFEWPNVKGAFEKLKEEISEFESEITAKTQDPDKMEAELGDVLFSLVNVARYYNLDADRALSMSNQKFKQRFEYIEQNSSKPLTNMDLEEMDALWNEAKTKGL